MRSEDGSETVATLCSADRDKLLSFDQEVTQFMRWWLMKNPLWLRHAMSVGGIQEVVQETCLAILQCPPKPSVNCRWTTMAVRQLRWRLMFMLSRAAKYREAERNYDSRLVMEPEQLERASAAELATRVHEVTRRAVGGRHLIALLGRIGERQFNEIGDELRVSTQRVMQLHAKAVRELQKPNWARELVEFLD